MRGVCSQEGLEQGLDLLREDFFKELMKELKSICRC